MSCVVGAQIPEIESSLASYADEFEGIFELANNTNQDESALLLKSLHGVTFVYPQGFFDWDEVSSHISKELKKPVFSFHIHDSEFWMFLMFVNGYEVVKFNPVPDFWEELVPELRCKWIPNPSQILEHVTHVSSNQIVPYLQLWPEEGLKGKAQENDEYGFEPMQLFDFMRVLGFDCPKPGKGIGYRFQMKQAY